MFTGDCAPPSFVTGHQMLSIQITIVRRSYRSYGRSLGTSWDVCDWQDIVCVIKAFGFPGRRRRSDDGRWYRLMTSRDSCIDDQERHRYQWNGTIVITGRDMI